MYIYINGNLVPPEEAVISAFDHGFLYGVGLFETFRVYDGHPFLLDDHLERLTQGLKAVNIRWTVTKQELLPAINQLLKANGLTNAYIRLNVSAGSGEIGLQTEPYSKPNIIIYMKPLPPVAGMNEKEAVLLETKRNTPEGKERLKSHHYLNNLLAKREIGPNPNVEGVFLTKEGFIAEGIVSNIFWIHKDALYTPSLETGILNGITRQFVFTLAQRLNVPIQEGLFTLNELIEAEEVFFTNSIQGIVPVSRFSGTTKPGKNGKWVNRFHKRYLNSCYHLWSSKEF